MSIVVSVSDKGGQFVAHHESPGGRAVTRAYRCPAGVVTIGHGFTMSSRIFAQWWRGKHGRALQMGDTIAHDDADMLLVRLIDEEYGAAVAREIRPKRQQHFDGAASVSFNCGPGALKWRWAMALARGDVGESARLLKTTAVTANGRRLAGLVRRRSEEADLIEKGRYGTAGALKRAAVSTTGDEVREYQQQLKSLGYDVGEIDGIAGPITTSAVKAFQDDHDLAVDGVVGPATRAALIRALDAKAAGKATGGGGAAGGVGGAGVESGGDPSALAEVNILTVVVIALAVAGVVAAGFWLWRNRGRITGRRVPT